MPFRKHRVFFCHRHTNRANKSFVLWVVKVFKELEINKGLLEQVFICLNANHLAYFFEQWVFGFTETHAPCEMVPTH